MAMSYIFALFMHLSISLFYIHLFPLLAYLFIYLFVHAVYIIIFNLSY